MEKTAVARPPGTEEALRKTIKQYGVLFPVIITERGHIIDGELRRRIAAELGVPCPEEIRPETRLSRSATVAFLEESRVREVAEKHYMTASMVTMLASELDENGVGRWPEAVIAAATGTSYEFVIRTMRRYLKPATYDVRDMFPRERRTVDGSVTAAAVTTADVTPVQAAPPALPQTHEVLDYIPQVSEKEFRELKEDLRRQGQLTPILMTNRGRILDGRARWTALTELGITPRTKVTDENPWLVGVGSNVHRFPGHWDRMMIFTSLPVSTPGYRNTPSGEEFAKVLALPHANARAFRRVVASESKELIQAVVTEKVRLWTVVRIMREVPQERWVEAVDLELARIGTRAVPKGAAKKGAVPVETPRTRRGTVGEVQIRKIEEQLIALGMVLDSTEGLDPHITREQAAAWYSSLSTARRHIGRLHTMLKQRKETI